RRSSCASLSCEAWPTHVATCRQAHHRGKGFPDPARRNPSVILLVGRVAGVASQPQLRGVLFEFVLGPRLACIVGIVSAGFAFLAEEIEDLPNGRICESVGGRIARSIRRQRVSGRREKMREGQ